MDDQTPMKLMFGEFLLMRGIVSEEALLDALLQQMRTSQAVAELVSEKKLMPTGDILKVLTLQCRKEIEFLVAGQELGVISDALARQIRRQVEKTSLPLGHYLVSSGAVKLEQLSDLLDKYLNEFCYAVARGVPPVAESTTVLPFEPQFVLIDREILGEYAEMLSDDRRSDLEKIARVWKQLVLDPAKHSVIAKSLRLTCREFHTIKGAARFIRADLTQQVIHEAEEVIALSVKMPSAELAPHIERIATITLKVMDLAWKIKQSLRSSGSEAGFWDNSETKALYIKVFLDVAELRSDLEQLLATNHRSDVMPKDLVGIVTEIVY